MNAEEDQKIKQLLAADASAAQQQQALSWLADYCEESYILNLPPSTAALAALNTFSNKTKINALLKRRAVTVVKQYKLR